MEERDVMETAQRPTRAWLRNGATALALVCGLAPTAFAQAPKLTYDPNHYQNNDPIWDELNRATIKADVERGVYVATFPKAVADRQAKTLRIAGFILPLEARTRSAHFSLVRRNTGCPFCPPNAPTEAVEVFAKAPAPYTGEEVTVSGRFELVASSADGLFYRVTGAEVSAGRR